MYIIAGHFKVKAECRVELIAMSKALLPPSRSEEGCISFDFYEDQSKENNFLFFERWQDRQSIDAHFHKNYFKDFAKRFPDMIEGDAEIKIYKIDNVETV